MEKYVIFCDLDGTLYIDGKPFKGISKMLCKLQTMGHEIFYTTNNTSSSSKEYRKKLSKLNFPLKAESLITPLNIAKNFFLQSKYKNTYLSGSKSVKNEFYLDTHKINLNKKPDSILMTFNKELHYEELLRLSQWINEGVPYFLTHIDYSCPTKHGPIPDCGAIGELLYRTTNIKYTDHFGKPGKYYSNHLKDIINKRASIFIGDRLYTDAKIGKDIGAKTIIVLSGETSKKSDDKEIHFYDTAYEFFETIIQND